MARDSGITRTKDVDTVIHQNDGEGEGHEGLKKNLRAGDLMGFGIGIVIGTGIFVLTGLEAKAHAGPAITVSFAIAGVVAMLAALCYAELAAAVPTAGSSYTYAYTTIGEVFAWIIGWDLVLEFALGSATVARGWSGYLQSALGLPTSLFGEKASFNLGAVFIVVVLGVIAAVGIRESKWVTNVLVLIKVSITVFVIVAGIFFLKASNLTPFFPASKPDTEAKGGLAQPLWQFATGASPTAYGVAGVLTAAAVVFFAYSGFEAVANLGEETENPGRDMPRGLIGTLVICTVLYLLVCLVLTAMVDYRTIDPSAPISEAFKQVGLDWAAVLVSIAAVAGLTSVILVDLVAMGRIGFALCRDGLLPPAVGKIHPKYQTPFRLTIGTTIVGRGDLGLRADRRPGRDGQHRHAVRLRGRGDRGRGAAAYQAEDGPPLQDPAGPGAADHLRAGLRRPDGQPGRGDLAAVPGLARGGHGHLLRLRPQPLPAGSRSQGRGRRGARRRQHRLTWRTPDVCTRWGRVLKMQLALSHRE